VLGAGGEPVTLVLNPLMTSPSPKILHADMDAFFASVEVRDDPKLVGLPVAVGGKADSRGVVAAASYEAREYGVRSAMPTARALELCPELVVVAPDFDRYTRASGQIMDIFQRYTPMVEPLSLDEAFLDTTGCERLFGDSIEIGRRIKQDILRETGLVVSIGIAPSKFLAKLASDLDKPNGFRVIREDEIRTVLDPLPVEKIFGVGQRTALRLKALGVQTVGDLAARDREEVSREFGASGAWIYDLAHGEDPRRVTPRRDEKSHGMERTFPEDISDREKLRLLLFEFCESVSYDLRTRGLRGRTVSIKARFWNFKTVSRTKTLSYPTNLGPRIHSTACELLDRVPPGPLRLLGVSVSSLEDVRAPRQAQLFGDGDVQTPAKDERVSLAVEGMDKIKRRYGRDAIVPASLLSRLAAARASDQRAEAARQGRKPQTHHA